MSEPDPILLHRLDERVTNIDDREKRQFKELSVKIKDNADDLKSLNKLRARYQAFGMVASFLGLSGLAVASLAIASFNTTKANYTELKKDLEIAENSLESAQERFTKFANEETVKILELHNDKLVRMDEWYIIQADDPNPLYLQHFKGETYIWSYPSQWVKEEWKEKYRFKFKKPENLIKKYQP